MNVIDDEGNVLGILNIIDLLVMLLVAAVVVAGVAFVTASQPNETQPITFQTTAQPDFVVDAIPAGAVVTDDVVAVTNQSATERDDGTYDVELEVELRVSMNGNVPMFQGERLYVGRTVQLDFGTTILEGTVIDMTPIEP